MFGAAISGGIFVMGAGNSVKGRLIVWCGLLLSLFEAIYFWLQLEKSSLRTCSILSSNVS